MRQPNYPSGKENTTDIKKIEAGWYGKIFGTGKNALNAHIFIVILMLILTILITAWRKEQEIYTTLIPILTLLIGYFVNNK